MSVEAKKDKEKAVASIIEKGTVKERLLLLFSHHAEVMFRKPPILSKEEIAQLRGSFKAPKELALFDKAVDTDRHIKDTLIYLNQYRFLYSTQIAHLQGLEGLWLERLNTADMLNTALKSISDTERREEAVKEILKHPISGSRFQKDENGYVFFDPDRPTAKTDLRRTALHYKEQAKACIWTAKPIIKALRDYMKKKGWRVKEYERQLAMIEGEFQRDNSLSPLFSKRKLTERAQNAKSVLDRTQAKVQLESEDNCFFYPEYEEIEFDEKGYKKHLESYLNEQNDKTESPS